MLDFYNILGLSRDAEDVVIRSAYKALAQKYHPDKWRHNPKLANQRMSEINQAYETLSSPIKRSNYDKNSHINENESQTKSYNNEKNKHKEILPYAYLILIAAALFFLLKNDNKKPEIKNDKATDIAIIEAKKVVEIAGIKYGDLLGIHMSVYSQMATQPLSPEHRLQIINYTNKFERKYIKNEKINESNRVGDLIAKDEIIHEAFHESLRSGIEVPLTLALIEEVSDFQRLYESYGSGAIGLMGVKTAFAENYTNIDPTNLFFIKINLRYGLTILRHLLDKRAGDMYLALGDYYDINLYNPKDPKLISKSKFIEEILAKRRYWSNRK
jgi:curved DNA-binding protein CbpA